MTREDGVVARRLRRLDAAGLARLVAALWAASGWETEVRDRRVVARRDTGAERRVLAVAAGPLGVARALVWPPGDVDAVVTTVGGPAVRVLSARCDAQVRGPASLRERLRYGLDPADRERVERTHLPPAGTATGTRRGVLAAAAAGVGATAAGGLKPGFRRPPGGWLRLADPRLFEATDAGGHGPTVSPENGLYCGVDPRTVVAVQLRELEGVRRANRSGLPRDVRVVVVDDPALTEPFLAALRTVDAGPLARAETVEVGERQTRDVDGEVAVPVRTLGPGGRTTYVFTLARTDGDCWRTTGVEIPEDGGAAALGAGDGTGRPLDGDADA